MHKVLWATADKTDQWGSETQINILWDWSIQKYLGDSSLGGIKSFFKMTKTWDPELEGEGSLLLIVHRVFMDFQQIFLNKEFQISQTKSLWDCKGIYFWTQQKCFWREKRRKKEKMPENRSLKTIEAHKLYFQFRKASLNRTEIYAHNYTLSIKRLDFNMCLSVVRV